MFHLFSRCRSIRLTCQALPAAWLLVLGVVVGAAPADAEVRVGVSPDKKFQPITGFGSGLVFYSNHMMEGLPAEHREEVYDWLWTDVEQDMLMFQTRNDIEKVNDNNDPFDLDRSKLDYKIVDKTARIMLEAQKRRGKDNITFIATLYSPPTWLKDNGKIKGGGFDTSKDVNYLEMAEFVYAYLDRLKTEHGIDTPYLTIANEPDWDHKQPGTKWSPEDLAKATALSVDHLRKLIKKTPGMVMPKIIAANTLSVRSANRYIQAIVDSPYPSAKRNTDIIGYHLYDTKVKAEHYERLQKFGLPMWMTEWTGPRNMPKGTKNPVSHSLGQMVGRFTAINGGASVVMHFEFGHPNHYSAGIFLAPWKKPWVRDTPYYAWQQLVNHTPRGDRAFRVLTKFDKSQRDKWANRVFAATDTQVGVTVIHISNPDKKGVDKLTLELAGVRPESATAYRTSLEENHVELPSDAVTIERRSVSFAVPSETFTTIKIKH